MLHSSLVGFLSGTISPEALTAEITAEVAAFRASLGETRNGRIVISDGPLFVVTKDGARRLLEAVASERMPFDVANYLADCIVLNDDFEFADDATREAIFFLEDDTGRFTTGDGEWRPSRQETLAALASLD